MSLRRSRRGNWLAPQAVADALDVPEEPGRSLVDALVDVLREKKLLVVLDFLVKASVGPWSPIESLR